MYVATCDFRRSTLHGITLAASRFIVPIYPSFCISYFFIRTYFYLSISFFFTILVLLSYNSMRCFLPPPLPLPSSHSINLQSLIYIATNVQVFRIVATLYIYTVHVCIYRTNVRCIYICIYLLCLYVRVVLILLYI